MGRRGSPKRAQREPVGQGLAQDEQDQYAERIVGGVLDQLRQRVLPREQHLGETPPGAQLVCHGDEADEQTERGGDQHRLTCTIRRSHNASERINHPRRAPAAPMTNAHAKLARVGGAAGGTEVKASETLPSPVQLPRPTKTNAPMPDASNPGSITRLSLIPPIPAISMIRNAPSTGEP